LLIAGSVCDAHGQPAPAARVFFVSGPTALPDIAALTDARGAFSLSVPVPGRYAIRAVSDRLGSATATVEVHGKGTTAVVIELGA
jgi:carboxypeptidase family protein